MHHTEQQLARYRKRPYTQLAPLFPPSIPRNQKRKRKQNTHTQKTNKQKKKQKKNKQKKKGMGINIIHSLEK